MDRTVVVIYFTTQKTMSEETETRRRLVSPFLRVSFTYREANIGFRDNSVRLRKHFFSDTIERSHSESLNNSVFNFSIYFISTES